MNSYLQIPDAMLGHVSELSRQLRMDVSDLLVQLAQVVSDEDFIGQALTINDKINFLSADN